MCNKYCVNKHNLKHFFRFYSFSCVVVMCMALPKAGSQPGPSLLKPSHIKPWGRLWRAHGLGLEFVEPGATAFCNFDWISGDEKLYIFMT